MRRIVFAALLAMPVIAGAQAPFCVVSANGEDCNYYDANQCQQTAGWRNGMCVARQKTQGQQLQMYDIAGSAQRGAEAGQRMRLEREEHEARLRVLDAQADSLRRDAQPRQGIVTYVCSGRDGHPYQTTTPAIGCVVKSIASD